MGSSTRDLRAGSRAATFAVLPALSQCTPTESRDDFDGVVRNSAPGEMVLAREVVRIGSLDGIGPATFGRVTSIAISPSGPIHIVDAMTQDIRACDSSGRYVQTVGRKGEGPGEFIRIDRILVDTDGALWVWDRGNMRVTVLDADGAVLRTLPRTGPWLAPRADAFADDGSFLVVGQSAAGLDRQRTAPHEVDWRYTPIRVGSDFEVIDSLRSLGEPVTAIGGRYPVPFTARMLMAFEPTGGGWFSHGGEYEVFRREASGDTSVVFSLEAPLVPVTRAEVDSAIAEY